jgi:hypothetical protein
MSVSFFVALPFALEKEKAVYAGTGFRRRAARGEKRRQSKVINYAFYGVPADATQLDGLVL